MEIECSDHSYVFVTTNLCRSQDNWILDSGYTYHMSPNRNWFSTYKSVEGGVVLMGNDTQSKTIGIGKIKTKMHDETYVMFLT